MITVDHVRELFAADAPDAALVLVEGRPEVVSDGETGGFLVARRDDLMRQSGRRDGDGPLSDSELQEIAQALDVSVSELGG
jgi:hypothetical protein